MSTLTQGAAKKVKKTCKAKVKVMELATERICGSELVGSDNMCPDRAQHVLSFRTPACVQGWCEGTIPTTFQGNPAPSCRWPWTCPCTCHVLFDRMFAESGMERQVVEKHHYKPDRSMFKSVPAEELARERAEARARSNAPDPDTAPVLESPAPGIVPAHYARSFDGTPSGRAARGELEYQVKQKCDEWLVEAYKYECTPAWLSKEIAAEWGVKPPSTGAIDAVFKRWLNLGFAKIEKKPTRFVGYTEAGIAKGLEVMKEENRLTRVQRDRQPLIPRR